MRVSQRDFFALDMDAGEADLLAGTDATLVRLPISRAESDGILPLVGSVVSADDDRIYDGVNRPGCRVVTFARLLKHNVFPLSAILNELLDTCRKDLGFAVEIEFAVTLDNDSSIEPEVYFLQMRPLVASRERCDVAIETLPPGKLVCRSERVLGNGRLEDLHDIVYICPEHFDRTQSARIATAVAELNERMARLRRPYLLIGPGRWGSWDPWIGIPVVWHQISWARVIVESSAKDFPIEPSQGTHFFHNLTSAGIGYFSVGRCDEREYIRWDLLEALPGEETETGLRHVHLDAPLTVRMDGQNQQGIISLP